VKIGIIGSGYVGATAAYAMVMRGVGRHIVLVDIDKVRAKAEANDIMHAVPFANPLQVTSGGYRDLDGCQVVVITAGVSQKEGETRLDLLSRNAEIFQQVIPRIIKYAPDAILLVTTNPVDLMTHIAAHYASEFNVPSSRVLGTGCTLDTARFRTLLGTRLGIDPSHVHAYVIGEHGDSEVLAWSIVTIGGIPLDKFCTNHGVSLSQTDYDEIETQVRRAAYNIIEGKGEKGRLIMGLGALSRVLLK
jgi:L-lactate dehydrogenase